MHEQWRQQAVALGVDPGRLMRAVVGRTRGVRLDRPAMWGVCEEAVLVISEKQSTWRPAELVRELAAVVPTVIGTNAAAIMAWLEQTARELVVSSCVDLSRPIPPGSHLRFDGRPVTESVLDRALTTQAILDQEAAVIGWAGHRLDHQADNEPGVITRDDGVITAAQAEVAAATAGWADLILVVGPAGTGKTTALAPAVEQLRRDGRAVFGVAPSAAAAQVLASETGVEADTIDKLLIEHHLTRPPDHRYQLPVGATIIVDEAGMLPTPTLASLADLADARGWRVVLIGDPMQFTAVGRGGLFTLLTDTYGAIELDRVHRFTHSWERDASLRLRRGDVEVTDLYDQHGRLHGGTPEQTERAAVRAWAGHRHHGARVLLMAPDNQTVDRLNQRAQQHRLDTNELDPTGRTVTTGSGMQLHAGDEIATRQNQRDLTTDQGDMVRNRACWTITAIHPDDSLTATGTHGTIRLPAAYVHDHVELAYATTGHGAQGRTVDHALLVLTSPTDIRNLYVPLTRGTHSNHAYITTIGEQTAHDVFAQSMTTDWIDQPAHTRQTELQHPGQHPGHHPGLLNPHHQRQLHDQQHELSDTLTTAVRDSNAISAELQLGLTERDTTRTRHDHLQTQVANAQHVIDTYDRPLRRARHHDEIAAARHTLATVPNQIEQASARLDELDNNIDQLETTLADTQHARTKQPDIEHQLDNIGDTLDQNRDLHTRITPRHPTDGPRMPSPAPTPNQQLRQQLQQLMPPTIEIDTPDIDL